MIGRFVVFYGLLTSLIWGIGYICHLADELRPVWWEGSALLSWGVLHAAVLTAFVLRWTGKDHK